MDQNLKNQIIKQRKKYPNKPMWVCVLDAKRKISLLKFTAKQMDVAYKARLKRGVA